jgi:hypothetical protein
LKSSTLPTPKMSSPGSSKSTGLPPDSIGSSDRAHRAALFRDVERRQKDVQVFEYTTSTRKPDHADLRQYEDGPDDVVGGPALAGRAP